MLSFPEFPQSIGFLKLELRPLDRGNTQLRSRLWALLEHPRDRELVHKCFAMLPNLSVLAFPSKWSWLAYPGTKIYVDGVFKENIWSGAQPVEAELPGFEEARLQCGSKQRGMLVERGPRKLIFIQMIQSA